MTRPPAIWLADLALAIAALDPADDRTVEVIIGLLGIGAAPGGGGPQPEGWWENSDEGRASRVQQPAGWDLETGARLGGADRDEEGAEQLDVLEPIGTVPGGLSRPWELAGDLEAVSERHLWGVRSYEPLFVRTWTRELLASTLALQVPSGRVDERELVGLVTRGRPVTEIPRRPRRSLSLGVQLLVDIGEGMEPFARDQSELIGEIRHVVGSSRVAVLRFRDCPTRGAGDGPAWTWKRYLPPEPGCPVLVLTDLGIGGPSVHSERSRPNEWVALVSRLQRRTSPLIAFVPYGRDRWPDQLRDVLTIVQWDRSTTVAKVHALTRSSRGAA